MSLTTVKFNPNDPYIAAAPSVEEQLATIRRALALSIVVYEAETVDGDESVREDARAAAQAVCETALQAAQELTWALPADILNLHVVDDETVAARADTPAGGAR